MDVSLGLFTDGFGIHKRRTIGCWPVIVLDLSLPPDTRSKAENVMVISLLPGSPKNRDSFLHPSVEELKVLASTGFLVYDSYKQQERRRNSDKAGF